MKNNKLMANKAVLAAAISVGLNAMAGPVLAQSRGFSLEEVLVTARKQEETLQNVPLAVTSFSSDDMSSLNMINTNDISSFTPNIYIEPAEGGNPTAAKVTIRGQVQAGNLITLDPSVGWYIDDVYLARAYGTSNSLFDVERVEVLKGPQGTLYGRNTTGGAVKLITTKADPGDAINGYVTGGVGSYQRQKLGGAINLPIVEDVLAVRLSALKDEVKEGFGEVTLVDAVTRANLGTKEAGGTKDAENYRIGVTWHAMDALNVLLSYDHTELDMSLLQYNQSTAAPFAGDVPVAPGGVLPLARSSRDFYKATVNTPYLADSETDTASLTLEYELTPDIATKLVYGWREVKSGFWADTDGTAVPFSYAIEPLTQKAKQQSVEWQVSGSAMDGNLDWITGLYWFEEEGWDRSVSNGLAQLNQGITSMLSVIAAENTSKSVFFSGTLHLTPSVNFTGGLRYTKDSKPVEVVASVVNNGVTQCRMDPSAPNADFVNCTWGEKDNYEFISWTAGFDWRVSETVMTYLKASSASRSGGQNGRGLDAISSQPFTEETATDIELGLKGSFFDNRIQLNAAYYHTFYDDVQRTLLLFTPAGSITTVVNATEADIDGLEVEAKWVVTDQLLLSATVGLIDWKFADNSVLGSAPDKDITLRANYLIPTSYGQWLLDLNHSWRSEYFSSTLPSREAARALPSSVVDSLGLVGARVAVDIDPLNLNVALWGRNLTDEEYFTSPLTLYSPPGLILSNGTVGEPRTFGVDFTWRF